jgi:nitrile hydratase accessory protein
MKSLDALPGIPRSGDEPVFRAPWEARAFGMAVALHEAGLFAWPEFAERLARAIAAAPDDDGSPQRAACRDPDSGASGGTPVGSRYYQHWLAALESLACERRLVGRDELARRVAEWDRAHRETPHGQPVELRRR